MRWLRLYDDVLDDEKVQQLPPALFKHWINLLCLASKGKPRGTLPDLDAIAWRIRLSPAKTRDVLAGLERVGLLERTEPGGLRPHNWEGRQRSSDDVTERVRRHRAHKDETLQLRFAERLETPLDTDTETEREETPPTPLPAPRPSPSSYEQVLNGSFPDFAGRFAALDPLLDEGWLRHVLRRIEPQVGALPSRGLRKGLGLAHRQVELRFAAVRAAKADPVHSPRKFAETILVSQLQEQRDGIPAQAGGGNGVRAGPAAP